MKIGIVILSHKHSDWISKLLSSLENQQVKNPICIVDNSEETNEIEKLQEIISQTSQQTELVIAKNQGYFLGNLAGIEKLKEKYGVTHCLILNPDVSSDNWQHIIDTLSSYFLKDNQCFIAGPKITIPGFRIVSSPIIPFKLWREIAYNVFFPLSNPILKSYHTKLSHKTGKVFAVEGSVFLIDSQKTIETKDFFKNIFLYGEETIFGKIAETKGWHIYFDNSVEVLHHHPPGETSPMYDKYLPLSYVEIAKKFYSSKFAIKLFETSIKHRFRIRRFLTKIMAN